MTQFKSISLLITIATFVSTITGCNLSRKKTVDSPKPAELATGQEVSESNEEIPPSSQETETAEEGSQQATREPMKPIWGYSGLIGPERWADLDPSFSLCREGKRQSPIDLKWRKPQPGGTIQASYFPGSLAMVDTGHTLQVLFPPGSRAELHGKTYSLTHMDIRSSSEHSLSKNTLPLELQFFHRAADGEIAVLSVIVIEGSEHPSIDKVFTYWPEQKLSPIRFKEVAFDPQSLLPEIMTHYAYTGSLTYPPCTEGIKWFVLNTPVPFSRSQIVKFRESYSANARPPQPLNGRKVVNY